MDSAKVVSDISVCQVPVTDSPMWSDVARGCRKLAAHSLRSFGEVVQCCTYVLLPKLTSQRL